MSGDHDLAQLQRDVRTLKDRQEILDCIVRQSRGRDRHDVELIRGAYWDDAFDEHGGNVTPAPEYPDKANAGHAAFFSAIQHNVSTHTCEIDSDVAYCETYSLVTLMTKDQRATIIAPGRYIDQMERRDGEWRIAMRRCTVEMSAQGKTDFLHSAPVKGFLKGQWNRDDVSYQRPVRRNPADPRW